MGENRTSYILFDDHLRDHLLPLTFTRPASELRIGILTIREKWEKWTGESFSWLTQQYLSEKFPVKASDDNIVINGSITPNQDLISEINELKPGEVLLKELIFIAGRLGKDDIDQFDGLPPRGYSRKEAHSQFNKISRVWHIFRNNGFELESDFEIITKGRESAALSSTNNIIKPERIFIEQGAQLEYVTLNATPGPIYIGKNSLIMEGSLIRGSLALCEGARIKMGTRIYGPTTIGPYSKAGGEITNSVIMGYSNKVHEGYMGNSVIGEYCNIGAGSNTSNLKNNYALVKVWNYATGKFEDTDLQFCGLLMGDYSRSGINTMFNTGTVVGICSNLYGTGFPGNFIPSFTWGGASGLETYRLDKAIETIKMGMSLHQKEFGETDLRIIDWLFMLTGRYRKTAYN
ncbi:MAG TPA: GlmU family protein [Bacteroidales bacterium]|jgi:UDP-N-acetylglucosamine diphosphorylase/glucosamine-1-phosphate N-acetyltransferase|nr:GlmU family protein [Bacteroidales bacterium]